MKNVLVDFSHLAYRSFFSCRTDIEDVGWGFFKHVMYNSIFSFCYKFNPDRIIIAADSKMNWRKKVYPSYKGNRKEKRDLQDDVDWEGLYGAMDELLKEMSVYFPFMVLRIQYMEADDIIGAYVKYHQDETSVIVTSDNDYIQLLQYKNASIYDPMQGKFKKSTDPLKDLKVKILSGDNGDNIPNIIKRTMKDTVKKRLGEKTAEKMVESPEKLKDLFNDDTLILEENGDTAYITENDQKIELTIGKQAKLGYKRNSILIDFNHIPDKLVQIMNNTIDDYIMPDGKNIFKYFSKNKFREFINKMDYVEKAIQPLIVFNEQQKAFT